MLYSLPKLCPEVQKLHNILLKAIKHEHEHELSLKYVAITKVAILHTIYDIMVDKNKTKNNKKNPRNIQKCSCTSVHI